MVTSLKERDYSHREQIISFMRSPTPLDSQYGDVTKGKSFLTGGADYFIYEKHHTPGFSIW